LALALGDIPVADHMAGHAVADCMAVAVGMVVAVDMVVKAPPVDMAVDVDMVVKAPPVDMAVDAVADYSSDSHTPHRTSYQDRSSFYNVDRTRPLLPHAYYTHNLCKKRCP
jgi:hypothetical protein